MNYTPNFQYYYIHNSHFTTIQNIIIHQEYGQNKLKLYDNMNNIKLHESRINIIVKISLF